MSASTRVYLPTTMTGLAGLHAQGVLEVEAATAVTAGLRAALPGMDEEELELEALLDAAELSLALLGPGQPPRRVVVAADAADTDVRAAEELGVSVVRIAGPVRLAVVASVHVDEPAAAARVAAGEVEELDLLWYAPTEIGELLRG